MTAPARESLSSAILFRNVEDAYRFMFGPDQHDAHVQKYRVRMKDIARAAHERPLFRNIDTGDALSRVLRRHGDL